MRSFAILIIICIFAPSFCHAQSANRNYIEHVTMLDENGQNGVTTVEYFDSLGRKMQSVSNGIVPGSATQTLLSRTIYDGLGREWQNLLPATASGLDCIDTVYYKDNDQKALSEITYDALNRPLSITTPGSDMIGKAKQKRYGTNASHTVKRYHVTATGSLSDDGFYQKGSLILETSVDENGCSTETYTDIFGQKVLERNRLIGNNNADTYFVYNECGKLSFILQPMYQKDRNLDKYAFRYLYNSRGLMTEKVIPGSERISYSYDSADRLLTMQDGEMMRKGQLLYHIYDGIGRLSTQILQSGGTTICTTQRNYYDGDYSFLNDGTVLLTSAERALLMYSGSMGTTSMTNQQLGYTFASGSIQYASDGTEIVAAMYYDAYGRMVEKNTKLLGSHIRREQFAHTFTGQVLSHTVIDFNDNTEVFRSVATNNYDTTTGILTSVDLTTKVNGTNQTTRRIAEYEYDGYGRVAAETYGSVRQTKTYDVRDWTTELAAPNFTERMAYTGRYYNGNINSIQCSGSNFDYTYNFSYDKLNRMTSAYYQTQHEAEEWWAEDCEFTEGVAYDYNGNITNIYRTGFPDEGACTTLIDDLELSYNGNQLTDVLDFENDPTYLTTKNFISFSDASCQYTYNANGAMETDANKGIVFTEYDTFGYPKSVYFSNGCITDYVYTPDGQKLRATYTTAVQNITMPMGQSFTLSPSQTQSVITKDYWGEDVICRNNVPIQYLFGNGYADINNNALTWHYYVKDHLGSTRIVQNEQGRVEGGFHYYPFGTQFAHHHEIYENRVSPPRTFSGKELENMYGSSSGFYEYDFGARHHDPLLGRWTSVDPLAEKYPNVSPYVYCVNNPVRYIDPDGRKIRFADGVSDAFKENFAKAVNYLKENKCDGLLAKLEKRNEIIYIAERNDGTSPGYNHNNHTIYWDPYGGVSTTNNKILSPTTVLNHEADHAYEHMTNKTTYTINSSATDKYYRSKEEKRVITGSEQRTALALGEIQLNEKTRDDHIGYYYPTVSPISTELDIDKESPTLLEEIEVKPQ